MHHPFRRRDPEGIVQFNEFLVIDHLRANGPLSRAQLSRSLGLSPPTVGRIIGRLLAAGSVRDVGPAPSGNGRRPTLVEFNPRSGSVIAVDVGGTNIHAAVADLGGEILWESLRPTRDGDTEPLDVLIEVLDDCLTAAAGVPGVAMAAVIGVPAILNQQTGILTAAPNVGWKGLDLAAHLAEHLPIPFVIENDVNLAAEAHAWRGQAHNVPDFVVLSIGTGIGGAIVTDGRLLRGSSSAAGEVGYLVPDRALLRRGAVDPLGAWELVASGPAVAQRAKELLASEEGSESALRQHSGELRAEHVFAAAVDGDPVASRVVDEFVDWLAVGIADIAAVVDPELIVLDGGVARSLEPLVPRVVSILERLLPRAPRLVVSNLGRNATVVGATAAAIRLATEPRPSAETSTRRGSAYVR